jgi:hypothetical protein
MDVAFKYHDNVYVTEFMSGQTTIGYPDAHLKCYMLASPGFT